MDKYSRWNINYVSMSLHSFSSQYFLKVEMKNTTKQNNDRSRIDILEDRAWAEEDRIVLHKTT